MNRLLLLTIYLTFLLAMARGQIGTGKQLINIYVKNAQPQTIFLRTSINNKLVTVDSGGIKQAEDTIRLKGIKWSEEKQYELVFGTHRYLTVILSDTLVPVEVDYDFSSKYSISDMSNFYLIFRNSSSSIEFNKARYEPVIWKRSRIKYLDSLQKNNATSSYKSKIDSLNILIKDFYLDVLSKSQSPCVISFTLSRLKDELKKEELKKIMERVKVRFPASEIVSKSIAFLEKPPLVQSSLASGSIAPSFEYVTIEGKKGRLEDFRGSYLLIDFWASWCRPCRLESPYLLAAQRKFADKNFKILSISLDKAVDVLKWKRAIVDDQTDPFEHVLDITPSDDSKDLIRTRYMVNAIPTNYLINPEGKIVAANLRGKKLQEFLERIFKASF